MPYIILSSMIVVAVTCVCELQYKDSYQFLCLGVHYSLTRCKLVFMILGAERIVADCRWYSGFPSSLGYVRWPRQRSAIRIWQVVTLWFY